MKINKLAPPPYIYIDFLQRGGQGAGLMRLLSSRLPKGSLRRSDESQMLSDLGGANF